MLNLPGMLEAIARHRRLISSVAMSVIAIAVVVVALCSATDTIGDRAFAIEGPDKLTLEVVAVSSSTVALRGGSADLKRDMVVGLETRDAYAVLGTIVATEGNVVTRELVNVHGEIHVGEPARLDIPAYPRDPQGLDALFYQTVHYSGPLGEMPAWFIPGDGDTWFIYVHGKASAPREGWRLFSVPAALGMPVLAIHYRNDPEAPSIEGDRYHYGETEWEDLEAGMRWARERGARRFVLAGHSMGGAVVLSLMYRSPMADEVSALVLDAPTLDLSRTIESGIEDAGVPGFAAPLLRRIVGWREDVDFADVDYLSRADRLATPVLLFHGSDDRLVPVDLSRELAATRPDIVTYVEVAGAGHTQAWNADPDRYQSALERFLQRVR
jgi:alpha-beta hydrolase superfamily lysophospholipase